jgi:colanic acid biosynthesis glycosyl transferase WcaI
VPRVLIYSLVYPPDGVSTAQLLGELAEGLTRRGADVRVVTTVPIYRTSEALHAGVELRRRMFGLWYTSLQGDVRVWHVNCPAGGGRLARLASWVLMHTVGALLALVVPARGSVILVPSPLLTLGLVARVVAALRGGRLVYNAQELYPDLAVDLGYIRSPAVIGALKWVERRVYAGATAVTAITPGIARRIRERAPDTPVETIPNFVDLDVLRPLPRSNDFAAEHGLDDRPVLSYAGVMGPAQGLDALLDLVAGFPPDAGVTTLLIGEGRSCDGLRERTLRQGIPGVRFIDHQPFARVPEIYAASDLSVVSLLPGVSANALPSKLLRIMACGRPVLAICPEASDLAAEVRRAGAGIVVAPDRAAVAADEVLELLESDEARKRMGRAGRAWVERNYAREVVTDRYKALIDAVAPA